MLMYNDIVMFFTGILYARGEIMVRISVCVGSACHLLGAHGVLEAFNGLIDKYHVQAKVDMQGNFCQGRCTEGVVIRIDEEIITKVSKEKVHGIFVEKVLDKLSNA